MPTNLIIHEKDQFPERYHLPKLIQEEIDDLNRPISSEEIESIINKFPKPKAPGPDGSLVNSTKYLRKKLYPLSTTSFKG